MKALVYHGPGHKEWESVPDPAILAPTDAIVRIDTTTICGTDLHILQGDCPEVKEGTVLGHEGVGTVVEVGAAVGNVRAGDRVIVSCISSCAVCSYCRKGMPSHCLGMGGIGWVLGHLIDGTQAEYVRTPFADTSLYKVPDALTDEQAVMVSDIFPTGFEIGVRYGDISPGDVVAVVGVGPVGLAAVATAKLYGPSKVIAVGRSRPRIDHALRMGADVGVSTNDPDWADVVMAQTDGLGVDVVIEAVGVPRTLQDCVRIVRPGGHIANAGVHGRPVELPMESMWINNLTLTTGLVDGTSSPMLIDLMVAGRLQPEQMVTHRFALEEMVKAYEVFADAPTWDALKVAIHREA
ncbi:Alcohol dehydrogenase GroES domain protein [Xylanimonas cellulosilytica DSM 15894]|uniref:Alcohol dehydrogenase GroES domain protein n=1 Tax=Xylanimonas cellulosilytica (strain DSM 15894 / JCM 12276 / CECT 5975 / KCTC 9989 / LMG 20990 / NBRC 107835 / XIL07) TaxID=446471 RepID=D1BUL7_XYLCX|nr:alcohol dehydrogenase catalytic domain-containing protein [Xylanimonas cellulosilytica]ACZ29258.1 Alcohol dehydrogenase GroES domain protein [Xylanimonas cellulosilytica DSM 15894]